MQITVSPNHSQLLSSNEVILPHQTWLDYENLLNIRQGQTLPKIYFNSLTQEIRLMSPLPGHGNRIDTLRDLIKLLLRRQGSDWHCFDPITLKKFEQAGLEPDTCFYITNRQAILGKEKLDLAIDPPPDLAVEIDLTSSTKPEDYQPFAIPELWIYRQGELLIYLWDNPTYQESQTSQIFPDIDVKNLLPQYVELAWTKGSSIALRQFEQDL
jgi:Uma2 family endonuclease